MERPEYLMCAAIWFDTGKTPQDPRVLPRNKKDGFLICGRRHHNCYGTLFSLLGHIGAREVEHKGVEGFLTSRDRFLDRKEAQEFGTETGQVTSIIGSTLTSEDLW